MEHVHGNVNAEQSFNYGDFITSGNLRVRKDLILAYMQNYDPEKKEDVGVKFLVGGGWLIADFDHEGTKKELERLDWIFKKEYRVEK